jgi:predicted transcriptional regulator
MATGGTTRRETGSPIGDIAYLARSRHRVPALVALTERPRSRAELCELTGVSSSTIRRTLGEFEARNWIRKDGYEYTATRLGEVVASGMEDLIERVETERKLRDVWDGLPDEVSEFTFETRSATTVTVAEYDAPYRPVNRFRSLVRESDSLRFVGVDVGLYEPCKDEFRRRVLDGMEAEVVDSPGVARYMCETYPERCADLVESGNLTVLVHDDLPSYGVTVFDDRIAISGYDHESGSVTVLVDTDTPAAREWGESVYDAYRSDARPFDAAAVVG